MYKETIKNIRSPLGAFWFTFVLGVFGVALTFWKLGKEIYLFSYHLAVGFLVGLGLGFGVSILERSIYIRHCRQQGANSLYKTTSLPKYIMLLLTILLVLINSKVEIGYAVAITIVGATYLLTLAVILFRIRTNKHIIIT